MKQKVIKYFSISLLLLLFISKGLITVLPLFTDLCFTADRLEMQMNSQSENTEENNNENRLEIKEFLGHFYNDHAASTKYARVSENFFPMESQFETAVFLPVNTPPPKFID